MLVLARKEGETIVIDGRILVHVLKTRKGSVRIGIEAPADVPVRRGELAARPPAPRRRDPVEAA